MVAIFLHMHGLLASSSILQTVASDPHIFFNFFKAYLLKETSINVNYLLSCWEGVFTITNFHQYYFEIAFPLIGTSISDTFESVRVWIFEFGKSGSGQMTQETCKTGYSMHPDVGRKNIYCLWAGPGLNCFDDFDQLKN